MNPPVSQPSFTTGLCPRCGSSSTAPFAAGGVCLRCAGTRVLERESGAPFSHSEISLGGTAEDRAGLPDRIGDYEIIEELGRGGMARVFAARQIGLGRIVALKAIPATRGDAAALELRFLRETQTVASLRHPHIVTIYDSGRSHGFVWFSMDYVEGGDLARRLHDRPFVPRDAAVLLQKVASALAYTHSVGVLHRDLKPSNILLDGDEPRVADFGLAAQLEPGGDLTSLTGVLGTPHYLAPEALREGSAALTVASDLYALGVILFELLTGRTPFAGASPAELPNLLAKHDAPSPRLLAPAVSRDLAAICLKCLEHDPAQRYASAAALEGDLRRYLAGEPTVAQPLSRWTIVRKFSTRHRAVLAGSGAFVAVLIAATAISTREALRARRAEKVAATEAAVSREVREFLEVDLLAQASPDQQPNRDLPLRTVLDRAAKKIDGHFKNEPVVEASLRETLAATYDSLGEYVSEQAQLERALELRRTAGGPDDAAAINTLDHLGIAMAQQGKLKQADPLIHESAERAERALGVRHPTTIRTLNDLTYIYKAQGKLAEAEASSRRAVALSRQALTPESDEARAALNNLSTVLYSMRKLEEAEAFNVEALAVEERVLGPEHPETLTVMGNLASVYWAEEKFAESEQINRRILELRTKLLSPEHPETLRSMNNLGTSLQNFGKFAEAATILEKAAELRRRVMGPESGDALSSQMNLAMAYSDLGRHDEAIALGAPTLATARRALGAEHYLTLGMALNLGRLEINQGDSAAAEPLLAETYAVRLRLSGPENMQTVVCAEALAEARVQNGKYTDALPLLESSLAWRRKNTPQHWRVPMLRNLIGAVYAGQQRNGEAEPLLVEGFEGLEKQTMLPPEAIHYYRERAGARLADFYAQTNRPEAAAAIRARVQKAK